MDHRQVALHPFGRTDLQPRPYRRGSFFVQSGIKKSQLMRANILDVDADAIPAQGVRRVDRGDG